MSAFHPSPTAQRRKRPRPPAKPARPSPLYAGVKAMVRDRIESGEWPPHTRVPSENELVAELNVSRMTVNRALRELATEGALVRIQGVGSFVAERKGHTELFEVLNIADEISGRGHAYSADVVLLDTEKAAPAVADALELEIGAPVFHSIVVHRENGMPVQIEDRFVSPVTAPGYVEQDFALVTPNAYLSRVAPLAVAEHLVEAVLPERWECKLLVILGTEPCLLIRRRTWSAGRIVSAARLLYPGSRYQLQSRWEPGGR